MDTEGSSVQVWTWDQADGEGYTTYKGLTAIGDMFDALWAGMNAASDADGSSGLGVAAEFPRVETEMNSVFLVWNSFSNPKATDTFLFDAAGKILRQTIVTTVEEATYSPATVSAAWDNHFEDLFTTLTPTPGLNIPAFSTAEANPTVENAGVDGSMEAANVFLVWQSVDQGILKATDTFMWKKVGSVVKVKKQNIVATQPSACPAEPEPNPAAPVTNASSPIAMGWNNHFEAFGAQDKAKILLDYTEGSSVQVWTWDQADGEGYTTYKGLTAIGNM